jgi:hypothetical protein
MRNSLVKLSLRYPEKLYFCPFAEIERKKAVVSSKNFIFITINIDSIYGLKIHAGQIAKN